MYPDLVGRNPEGQPESVRYEQINAMLLNEFLKEHRKVEKLEAIVASLATQLDKVAAQVQINKPAMQVAVENYYTFGASGIPLRQFPCKELLPCLLFK